jgi:hypothetical protein
MNRLTEEINSRMVPHTALIAYKGDGQLEHEYYVEVRKIGENGVMGAGRPVTYKFMEEIAKNYVAAHNGTPHGAVPANMLFCDVRKGCERYIWYNPPGIRKMYFKKSLGLENRGYHVPGVVYVAGDSWLHIFAYIGDKADAETELYDGPFFNTTNGSVCLGSADLKMPSDPTYDQLIEYWEKRFWMTEFSHLGGSENPTKTNLVVVTKKAVEKPFDVKQLIKSGKILKQMYR